MRKEDILLILVAIVFLVVAVVLGVSVLSKLQEGEPPPTPVVFRATLSPTPTDLPTATSTPTPTMVPSPTPVPSFDTVTLGTILNGAQVLDAGHTFPPGTTQVFAVCTYHDMGIETPYRVSWYLDDALWSEKQAAWDLGRYGSEGKALVDAISEYGGSGLPAGNYRLELYVGERQVQLATFTILAPTPTPLPPTSTPAPDMQVAGQQAVRSLVQVWVRSELPFVSNQAGSGSIVDGNQGLILTNWHVLSDRRGRLLNDGGEAAIYITNDSESSPVFAYWAKFLPEYSDLSLDLAMLKITRWARDETLVTGPLNLPAIELGDSALMRRGDRVLLLGFPDFAEGDLSWTEGVVVTRDSQWIKSDAKVSHGHSGGMMLNQRGELIGIPTQHQTTTTGEGLAVARPINLARPLLERAAAGPPLPTGTPGGEGGFTGDERMVLVAEQLNLRAEPSIDSRVLGTLARGTKVRVLGAPRWDGERLWYNVQPVGSGQVGWASGRYLAGMDVFQTPILFSSNRAGSYDVYSILPDGRSLSRLTSDPGDEGDASWSPDHRKIAFSSDLSGDADLYTMSLEDSIWHPVTNGPADDLHPAWSPDGTRLAFVSDRDGDWEIYVANVDGTGVRQLTFNDHWDSYPDWSPDGTRLAFTSRQDGNYDLYLVVVSNGELQRLTANPYTDAHPAWSPGGQQIAYTVVIPQGGSLRREIGILDLDDLSYTRRTPFSQRGQALYSFPDWSPDGRWIVFTSEVDGNQEICLAAMDGDLVVNLSIAALASDYGPAWTP